MEGLAECCVLLMQKAKAQGLSLIKQTVLISEHAMDSCILWNAEIKYLLIIAARDCHACAFYVQCLPACVA